LYGISVVILVVGHTKTTRREMSIDSL